MAIGKHFGADTCVKGLARPHFPRGKMAARTGFRRRQFPPLFPHPPCRPRREPHRHGCAAAAGGLPALHPGRGTAAPGRPQRAGRCWRRTWSRAFCCSPTSAPPLISRRCKQDDARADVLFRDATDALIAWQLASRPGVLPPYDCGLAAARARSVSRLVSGAASRPGARAAAARAAGAHVRADSGKQSGAARGVRASRLHAAQPHAVRAQSRHPRFPGCGVRSGQLRPGLAGARRFHQLGRGARARLDRALLGQGAPRRAAGRFRLRRLLPRSRMDGPAAPSESARHISRASGTATASPAMSRTRRASSPMCARSPPATMRSPRSRICSTRSRTNRQRAEEIFP